MMLINSYVLVPTTSEANLFLSLSKLVMPASKARESLSWELELSRGNLENWRYSFEKLPRTQVRGSFSNAIFLVITHNA